MLAQIGIWLSSIFGLRSGSVNQACNFGHFICPIPVDEHLYNQPPLYAFLGVTEKCNIFYANFDNLNRSLHETELDFAERLKLIDARKDTKEWDCTGAKVGLTAAFNPYYMVQNGNKFNLSIVECDWIYEHNLYITVCRPRTTRTKKIELPIEYEFVSSYPWSGIMELCFVVGKSEGANELLNFCINPTELDQFVNLSKLLEYPSIRQWYLSGTHFHANQNPPQLIHYIDSSGRRLKRVKQLSDGSHLSVPFADGSMRHRLSKSPTAISTDNYRHIFSFQLANGYIWYVAEHGGMPDLACFMATTQYVDLMLMYESGYGSLGYRFGEAIKRKQILSV